MRIGLKINFLLKMNGSRSVITENGAIFICGGEIKNASKIDATEN